MKVFARISGTGSYLPDKVVTNQDLEESLDTSDAWIRDRTGIKRRHVAADGELTSDMAVKAALNALASADCDPNDIDLVIIATTTPDKVFPSTACIVQRKLGIHGCAAFDVHAACAGIVYALDVANRYFLTGGAHKALVIGSETYSRILDWTDRTTCVLFGDGAGAMVLEASIEPGILSTHIHAEGRYEELLHVPAGISSNYDAVLAQNAYIQMSGNEVFKKAVGALDSMARETLADNDVSPADLDWFVPHQANLRIINAAAKKLGLPLEKVVVTVDEHANTSSASIPLAFDAAVRDGRIQRGELVLFEAFGAGFTWGSTLLRY